MIHLNTHKMKFIRIDSNKIKLFNMHISSLYQKARTVTLNNDCGPIENRFAHVLIKLATII